MSKELKNLTPLCHIFLDRLKGLGSFVHVPGGLSALEVSIVGRLGDESLHVFSIMLQRLDFLVLDVVSSEN